MRKFPLMLILCVFAACLFTSCLGKDSNTWEDYAENRNLNNSWLTEQITKKNSDGTDFYKKLVASWDSQSFVYIHYFNDTTLTRGNLSPLYTSTCDAIYHLSLYNGTAVDSSYLRTTPADSVYRFKPSGVITGWAIAIQNMHIGDSCEVLVPYASAYGSSTSYSGIPPYSNLVFGVKLVGIPAYEIQP